MGEIKGHGHHQDVQPSEPTGRCLPGVCCARGVICIALVTRPCLIAIIDGTCHKYHFCLTKYFCCDKTFVMTNMCLSRQMFCQFCHDKHTSVATKDVICHNKHKMFVMTNICPNVLLQQAYFCCDKGFVVTNILLS